MTPSESKKKILLLDDDKFLVEMYAAKFQQQGYTVMAALSVNEALKDLREGYQPDIIIFDLVMPEHDGISFLNSLNKEKLAEKAVKITLTNQYDDAERQKAIDSGADKCIVKASVVPSDVVRIVEDAITHKKWDLK